MRPILAMHDVVHLLFYESIAFGDFGLGNALIPKFANLKHIGLCYFAAWVFLAWRTIVAASTFVQHIVRVFSWRAGEKMAWIYARWIVATMTHEHTLLDRDVVDFVGNTMCKKMAVSRQKASVPIAKFLSLPEPTIVGRSRGDVFPESLTVGNFVLMTRNVFVRFALDVSMARVILQRERRSLSTSAMTKAVGCIVRGIIGAHKNLQFLCQAQDAVNVAGHFLLGCYRSILAHLNEYRKVQRTAELLEASKP